MATCKPYCNFAKILAQKKIDWVNDTIKVMFCTSTYVPNQDTHATKADVTGEVSGTGYIAGGITLTGKTLTLDAVNNKVMLDADDILLSNSTIANVRYCVIYDATDESNPLIAWGDFVTDQTSQNGDFGITWDANGVTYISIDA